MRKALSLIELIFTIVIIAVVFTVIPKIIFALNKSDAFSIKQDALFNGVTLMQMISKLDWDENNTVTNDILGTANGDGRFTCNSTTDYYRQGGFIGSRNCKENNAFFSASAIGKDFADTNTSVFNDMDDFDNNGSITSMYRLRTSVYYINDNIVGNGGLIDLNLSNPLAGTSNLKRIHVDITTSYTGNKKNVAPESIAQFDYVSSNIGKTSLNKRIW